MEIKLIDVFERIEEVRNKYRNGILSKTMALNELHRIGLIAEVLKKMAEMDNELLEDLFFILKIK